MRLAAPGPHGGDGRRLSAALGLDPDTVVDLSASLNPFAPDVARLAATTLARHPDIVSSYPDASHATTALAAAIGVDADRLVLTNGGAEAIALVAADAPVGAITDPEFSLYRRHLTTVREDAPRWRSNPSNPRGTLAAATEDAAVWDEAFYPLATGNWTRGDEQSWRLGSLTKVWACPGLRLGYVIAPDRAGADRLRRAQPQWAVNGLIATLVPELLEATDLHAWQRALRTSQHAFAAELAALGFTVTTTEANWVLVARSDLRSRLAHHGVVVRDLTSFGLGGMFRVALPSAGQHDRVLTAFSAIGP